MSDGRAAGAPLSVAVLVDLPWEPAAGGHVKAWERFAAAATAFPDRLDLTVYFLESDPGAPRQEMLSDTVRYRMIRPRLGTRSIPFLRQGGGDTDLAGFNRDLAGFLPGHDVLHATSNFAFAKTALREKVRSGRPLAYSIHTDVPKFTRIYTREVVENLLGRGAAARLLTERLRVQERAARSIERATDRTLTRADAVIVSNMDEWHRCAAFLPEAKLSYLRRGIDKAQFDPARRDRAWAAARFGLPAEGTPVALFAGRVDETKRVLTAARAIAALRAEGHAVHLAVAGHGSAAGDVAALLGPAAHLTGPLPQDDLARLMAACDLFVFPSESETVGNVVIEAKAAGLPVILSGKGATRQCVETSGVDGLVLDDVEPPALAAAIRPLLTDGPRRKAMAAAARAHIAARWPSWRDVVAEDLLPVWQRLANG